ncbi:MAG: chemotaxis protein CheW [Chloroflexi bacterium]|nr:chemotaxis protein CheW [Chloroflexota bacterium]
MEQQLVVFDLAGESYGINIAAVESIIKMQTITQLPQAPVYVKGVTNLRGSVLPVIDLRIRFGLEIQEISRQTRIIIVTMGNLKVGVVVDGVSEVLRVQDDTIEALPPMVSTVNSAFLKGIVRLENRLIILLELGKVLDFEEQKSLAAMA